jgi:hypothetical protein
MKAAFAAGRDIAFISDAPMGASRSLDHGYGVAATRPHDRIELLASTAAHVHRIDGGRERFGVEIQSSVRRNSFRRPSLNRLSGWLTMAHLDLPSESRCSSRAIARFLITRAKPLPSWNPVDLASSLGFK